MPDRFQAASGCFPDRGRDGGFFLFKPARRRLVVCPFGPTAGHPASSGFGFSISESHGWDDDTISSIPESQNYFI
jgi:hypothetical protein